MESNYVGDGIRVGRATALHLNLLPNAITIFRILLIVPVVSALLSENFRTALLLFFVAGASDGLDGFLARRFGWSSRFGALADPLADKMLLVSTYISLVLTGVFPLWFVIIVVARDVVIFSGSVAFHLLVGPFRGQPTMMGKACTFTQIVLGLLVVFELAVVPLPEWLTTWGIYLVVALCVISCVQYIWIGIGRAYRREVDEQ